ncbi:hypothetical protein [Kibdelosporangium aridum]|uniref:hypothetical protein n=1 Tax=Kibdelosporangium aridum TaxID=2030 RepID=UPI0005247D03
MQATLELGEVVARAVAQHALVDVGGLRVAEGFGVVVHGFGTRQINGAVFQSIGGVGQSRDQVAGKQDLNGGFVGGSC